MIKPILEPRTQSTLLIPVRFENDFLNKVKPNGREIYFHFMVKRYAPLVKAGVFGERKTIKVSYQKEEDNLVRKNFRPINSDWIEFGMLADYLGVSKTALFTMFLKLEISDWPVILREKWYAGGVPPMVSNISSGTHVSYAESIVVFRKLRYKFRK